MRHPDYDRAFHETPEYIRSAIELGFVKGKKAMKMRYKITSALSVAAAMVVILGAAAFGASRLGAPRPDGMLPGKPLSGPAATAAVTAVPEEPTPSPTPAEPATPEPTIPPELAETEAPSLEFVYYAAYGSYFHADPYCSGLENATEGSVQDAYHAAKEPCPICLADWSFEVRAVPAASAESIAIDESSFEGSGIKADDTVYASEQGNYFHLTPDCSGMVGAEDMTAKEALLLGKKSCPVCLPDVELSVVSVPEEEPLWMSGIVYAEYGAVEYFHRDAVCDGRENPRALTVDYALKEAKPCPDCLPVDQYTLVAIPDETMLALNEGTPFLYYTKGGTYFHRLSNCSNMLNAETHALQEAFASGKSPCPVCLADWSYVAVALPAEEFPVAVAEVYSVAMSESETTVISRSREEVEYIDFE